MRKLGLFICLSLLFATQALAESPKDARFARAWEAHNNTAHVWSVRGMDQSMSVCKKGIIDSLCYGALTVRGHLPNCFEARVTPKFVIEEWSWFPCNYVFKGLV